MRGAAGRGTTGSPAGHVHAANRGHKPHDHCTAEIRSPFAGTKGLRLKLNLRLVDTPVGTCYFEAESMTHGELGAHVTSAEILSQSR